MGQLQQPFEVSRAATWTCNVLLYGSKDGCDCDCGVWGPGCDATAGLTTVIPVTRKCVAACLEHFCTNQFACTIVWPNLRLLMQGSHHHPIALLQKHQSLQPPTSWHLLVYTGCDMVLPSVWWASCSLPEFVEHLYCLLFTMLTNSLRRRCGGHGSGRHCHI